MSLRLEHASNPNQKGQYLTKYSLEVAIERQVAFLPPVKDGVEFERPRKNLESCRMPHSYWRGLLPEAEKCTHFCH